MRNSIWAYVRYIRYAEPENLQGEKLKYCLPLVAVYLNRKKGRTDNRAEGKGGEKKFKVNFTNLRKIQVSKGIVWCIMKETKEGVATMCKMMEDMRNEAARKAELKSARETAERMIRKGKMPLEEIAEYIPSLSFEELRELETEIMQSA